MICQGKFIEVPLPDIISSVAYTPICKYRGKYYILEAYIKGNQFLMRDFEDDMFKKRIHKVISKFSSEDLKEILVVCVEDGVQKIAVPANQYHKFEYYINMVHSTTVHYEYFPSFDYNTYQYFLAAPFEYETGSKIVLSKEIVKSVPNLRINTPYHVLAYLPLQWHLNIKDDKGQRIKIHVSQLADERSIRMNKLKGILGQ